MITNELLETKYQTQRLLDAQAGRDLRTYARNVHEIVLAVEKEHGFKFRYRPVRKKVSGDSNAASKSMSRLAPVARRVAAGV